MISFTSAQPRAGRSHSRGSEKTKRPESERWGRWQSFKLQARCAARLPGGVRLRLAASDSVVAGAGHLKLLRSNQQKPNGTLVRSCHVCLSLGPPREKTPPPLLGIRTSEMKLGSWVPAIGPELLAGLIPSTEFYGTLRAGPGGAWPLVAVQAGWQKPPCLGPARKLLSILRGKV